MKKDIVEKYDLRAPRYTSYPTSPHFNDGVDGALYKRWLGKLDPATGLSLYSHIPFCDSMCWFCGCYTKVVKRYQPVAEYLEVLLDEIDLIAGFLPARFRTGHLQWGGGSPTMLKGADWLHIMERLRKRFDIAENAEIAVELDPRTTTEDYVKALAEAGMNRASIGVQGFHPQVQEAINRIQPFEVTERVVDWLRKHGINDVNMDLMYGLPHQTGERVARQAELAASLKPVRVALFGYAHVPWMKSHQKLIDEDALPGTAERLEQFNVSSLKLLELGYQPVGLDHFALPGDSLAVALKENRLHRNFQGYTTDEASVMLGFGASAIGQLPQGYAQNAAPLKAYADSVRAGEAPIARGIALGADDRLRGEIIQRLMCDLEVDLTAVSGRHGFEAGDFSAEMEKLAPLVADGVATIAGGRIAITEEGRPFVRLVAAAFDAYLGAGQGRHSKAV